MKHDPESAKQKLVVDDLKCHQHVFMILSALDDKIVWSECYFDIHTLEDLQSLKRETNFKTVQLFPLKPALMGLKRLLLLYNFENAIVSKQSQYRQIGKK